MTSNRHCKAWDSVFCSATIAIVASSELDLEKLLIISITPTNHQ